MSLINKASLLIIVMSIFLNAPLQSQSSQKIDSLVHEICQSVNLITSQTEVIPLDTVLYKIGKKHLDNYLLNISMDKIDSLVFLIDARLQKTCEEYGRLLYEQSEHNADWKRHSTKPEQKLKDEDCEGFYSKKDYRYLEVNGDTVKLEIKNGYWIDNFKDGTYSKLKIYSNKNCEIEIEFIESNNEIRRNFSKKGDKYKYTIIEKNEEFYKLSVEIPEQSIFYTFKMYYKEK